MDHSDKTDFWLLHYWFHQPDYEPREDIKKELVKRGFSMQALMDPKQPRGESWNRVMEALSELYQEHSTWGIISEEGLISDKGDGLLENLMLAYGDWLG